MLGCYLNEEIIYAWQANDKNADYRCPECKGEVILKKGIYKIPHFAHKANLGCNFGEGVTEEHLMVQKDIYEILTSLGFYCELECRRFEHRRADIYAEINDKKIVFEVQHSSITPQEILARNQYYSRQGCSVIWILTPDFFGKLKARVNPEKGIRLSQWQIRLTEIYGCLYVWWDKKLMAYQFDYARRSLSFDARTGEYVDVGEYQLKTTFEKLGYAEIDLAWAIRNNTLLTFDDEFFNTSCFGLSPDIDYAANWSFPDEHYRFSDPLTIAG
jgi:hypothetical protein